MIAAFGTLAFLVTLWLLVVVGAAVLEASGAKIVAALKGQPTANSALVPVRVRSRMKAAQAPMRAEPRQRVAA
jgi:hypothetical protein